MDDQMTAIPLRAYRDAINLVKRELLLDTTMSGAEVVDRLTERMNAAQREQDARRHPCGNCGFPVTWSTEHQGLRHVMDDGMISNAGCRAATFDRNGEEEGWDDEMPKKWKAK